MNGILRLISLLMLKAFNIFLIGYLTILWLSSITFASGVFTHEEINWHIPSDTDGVTTASDQGSWEAAV